MNQPAYTPLSALKRKAYARLRSARHRREDGLFAIEGTKSVLDTLGLFDCVALIATYSWLEEHGSEVAGLAVEVAKTADMERISSLSTPPPVVAVCRRPNHDIADMDFSGRLTLVLDGVQDPGNMGTIIRTADWFGVDTIVCSPDTVDAYSPKVVQASMGALSRVRVVYTDLVPFVEQFDPETVAGTFLDGEDLRSARLPAHGLIIMGNEGNGVTREVADMVGKRLFIPPYNAQPGAHVESLNVAIATGIILNAYRNGKD